jgi:hypothetical protein
MRMPRTPVATVHIGEMAVPRDITKEE